jgi:hypothetical protein
MSPNSRSSCQHSTAFQPPAAATSTSSSLLALLPGGQDRSRCQASSGRDSRVRLRLSRAGRADEPAGRVLHARAGGRAGARVYKLLSFFLHRTTQPIRQRLAQLS